MKVPIFLLWTSRDLTCGLKEDPPDRPSLGSSPRSIRKLSAVRPNIGRRKVAKLIGYTSGLVIGPDPMWV